MAREALDRSCPAAIDLEGAEPEPRAAVGAQLDPPAPGALDALHEHEHPGGRAGVAEQEAAALAAWPPRSGNAPK